MRRNAALDAAEAGLQSLVDSGELMDPATAAAVLKPWRIAYYEGVMRAEDKALPPDHPTRRKLACIERLKDSREDIRINWETTKPTRLLEDEIYRSDPIRNRWPRLEFGGVSNYPDG
jgi:hypothetical protein